MKRVTLDPRALGLAAGITAAALTTLCAFAVAVAPLATKEIASILFHLDLSAMGRAINWGVYFGSLIGWSVGTGSVFAVVAHLYNRLTREQSVAQERDPLFVR